MNRPLKIHLAAPPFAGHLFPLLSLGQHLQRQGLAELKVLSTSNAQDAITLSGLQGVTLLAGKEAAIQAIADPPYQVKHNPFILMKQLQGNLALMTTMKAELRALWQQDRPDLVIADSVLAVGGVLASEMQIPWWTTIATPCAIETQTATPTYLGGWTPKDTPLFKLRDKAGRKVIRSFKQFVAWRFAKDLKALGVTKLYRSNGEEVIYSKQKILALGMKEFEFQRDWPASLEFIGPVTASAPLAHQKPTFSAGKKHVLVSLGTHLPWAKAKALSFVKQVAERLPHICFHFSLGKSEGGSARQEGNVVIFDYLPYDLYLHNYDAAIIHGGTGITYSCIKAGVPVLVWPHDYDQFDHAARIVKRGLGLRFQNNLSKAEHDLERLFTDAHIQAQLELFQAHAAQYKPYERLSEFLRDFS